jgi:cytochrome P450
MLPHQHGTEHRRLRAVTRALFKETATRRLQNQIVGMLDSLLYPAVFKLDGCDIVNTLGVQVPETVSCILLDVAPGDRDAVGTWARQIYQQIGVYDQSEHEARTAETVYGEFHEYVMRRSKQPTGTVYGGVGQTLLDAHRGGALDDSQLLSYFALFLLTGLDTLTYAIANSVSFLGGSPEVFDQLRHEPELAGPAFREAMRLWGPIRLCVRHLHQPVELPATRIPENSVVYALIHAANRDPKRIARPDDLLWDRPARDSLAFGIGPHGCLGGALGITVGRALYYSLSVRCRTVRTTANISTASFVSSLPILGLDDVWLFAEPA